MIIVYSDYEGSGYYEEAPEIIGLIIPDEDFRNWCMALKRGPSRLSDEEIDGMMRRLNARYLNERLNIK
ncbi:MAG: hypothetical protein KGJ89_02210 [Patescibacteria group bacterium]|nr:hypothetical protein [Patescibacteria group bacterium]MDE2226748.1 hypothetical protein [Patescibacteria group bacterium]